MPNTHGIPDTLKELQAHDYDLLPSCLVYTAGLTPPGSGLTLASVAAAGYVRRATDLLYVSQAASSVPIGGAAGNHWLALAADTSTALAGWTRISGSHYIEQASATQPADPDGAHLIAQVVVTGAHVTAVTPLPSLPLSRQTSNAVDITGGAVTGLSNLASSATTLTGAFVSDGMSVANRSGDNVTALYSTIAATGGSGRYYLNHTGTAPSSLGGPLGIGAVSPPQTMLYLQYPKSAQHGLWLRPGDNDTGGYFAIVFTNQASNATVGSINTSATATTYNTSSDVRLKRFVQTLSGSLAVLRQSRPVGFLWNATDEYAEGFLAHELQKIPELSFAVTGEPDVVDEQGNIVPQQLDHSKLVPRMVSSILELLGQVEALTARVTSLETALGV